MKTATELVAEECRETVAPRLEALAPLKSSTLVVTGGTGFFGKWLAEAVAFLNDTFSFGVECHLVARNVEAFREQCPHLAKRKDIVLDRGDVRYVAELPGSTNWIVHAAAPPDNRVHATNPIETMSTIAQGTASVLEVASRCSHLRKILNVSSGQIYGDQPVDLARVSEDRAGTLSCSEPSSAYAEAKRFAETFCAATRTQARLPVVTIRPFAFVGPYQSLETPWAVNNFFRDALSGNQIRVLGNGQTVRSYMYGADMVAWVLSILVGAESGRTYNVGSKNPITIADVARLVAACFEPEPDIVIGSSLKTHPHVSRFVPDTSAAERDFGLDLQVSVQTAVARTVNWHRAARAAAI
jgi:nucleoside-diphosphate-sugar epimerase